MSKTVTLRFPNSLSEFVEATKALSLGAEFASNLVSIPFDYFGEHQRSANWSNLLNFHDDPRFNFHPLVLDEHSKDLPPSAVRFSTGPPLLHFLAYGEDQYVEAVFDMLVERFHIDVDDFEVFVGRDLTSPSGGNAMFFAVRAMRKLSFNLTFLFSISLAYAGMDFWAVACSPKETMDLPSLATMANEIKSCDKPPFRRTFRVEKQPLPDGTQPTFLNMVRRPLSYFGTVNTEVGQFT